VPHAQKVYLSHRRGQTIVPRTSRDGVPIDMDMSWKANRLLYWIDEYLESLHSWIINTYMRRVARQRWGPSDAAWRLEPAPSLVEGPRAICVNDELIPLLREGKLTSVHEIQKVVGPRSIQVVDGSIIDNVDAIVACTGYCENYYSIPAVTVTHVLPHLKTHAAYQPNLYMSIFPPKYADSLAILNHIFVPENAATIGELASIALGQLWSGRASFPTLEEMEVDIKDDQRVFAMNASKHGVDVHYDKPVRCHKVMRFLEETAGTGLYESLGWGWKGWRFWWDDRRFYNMVAWGVYTPSIYRLFETGKRKAWPGARTAIIHANEECERRFGKGAVAAREKEKDR